MADTKLTVISKTCATGKANNIEILMLVLEFLVNSMLKILNGISVESMKYDVMKEYRIARYFRRVFIFRYFKEAFFAKINSQIQLVFENIFPRLNKCLFTLT